MDSGNSHHGIGAVLSQHGQGVLHSQSGQTQQSGEHSHGSHQHSRQQGCIAGSLFVLGSLKAGDHFRTCKECTEIVEDVANDGNPADLADAQLLTGQRSRNGFPAAAALDDKGSGNGKTYQNDTKLNQVRDLVCHHTAKGGIENDDQAGDEQGHIDGNTGQRGNDRAGSRDLGRGQAEQRQYAEDCGEVAGDLAEPTADDLRNGHSHSLADLGRKVCQRDHGDGRRQNIPDGAHAPVAKGLLCQASGRAAADVVGRQRERDHKQAHSASGHQIVLTVFDVQLADHKADDQHAHQVSDHDNQGDQLKFHSFPPFSWYGLPY